MAFLIRGRRPLYGTVRTQGAKNAALPILFGCLLSEKPITLYGVPRIGDVAVALRLLSQMGVAIAEGEEGSITLDAENAKAPTLALAECCKIRASSYLLGASLSRFGEGSIPYPGGCAFGVRPLNYHKDAFCALGSCWEETDAGISVSIAQPKAANVFLPYPSVGATVNFILAALGVKGESTLCGYAREQHVLDFIAFLKSAGAKIDVCGNCLRIFGGIPLNGGSFTVPPDAIEAGTYLIAAAATGGEVRVEGVRYGELSPLLLVFRQMNIPFLFTGDSVTVYPSKSIHGAKVIAAPYPGFPTDLHPPMTALMAQAPSGGTVSDLVWGERFSYVDELLKMGARARLTPHTVCVLPSRLHGAHVVAPDLRGGAALVVAGLSAEGETVVSGEGCILRGYESLPQKLFALGADIARI